MMNHMHPETDAGQPCQQFQRRMANDQGLLLRRQKSPCCLLEYCRLRPAALVAASFEANRNRVGERFSHGTADQRWGRKHSEILIQSCPLVRRYFPYHVQSYIGWNHKPVNGRTKISQGCETSLRSGSVWTRRKWRTVRRAVG